MPVACLAPISESAASICRFGSPRSTPGLSSYGKRSLVVASGSSSLGEVGWTGGDFPGSEIFAGKVRGVTRARPGPHSGGPIVRGCQPP
jgi:hypothetical protein